MTRLVVQSCIGCGRVDVPAPCTGACDDRRIELVDAGAHDRAVAELDCARAALAALTALAARIAVPARGEAAYRALQAEARAALRALPSAAATDPHRIAAWWCAGCGRIEAPQPCLGVCVRRAEEAVPAEACDRAVAEAGELRRAAAPLAALARQLAWATPRDGGWDASLAALAERAAPLTLRASAPVAARAPAARA